MRYILLIFCMFSIQIITAQDSLKQTQADALIQQLETADQYGVKKNIYENLLELFSASDIEQLKTYADQYLLEAKENNDKEGIALSNYFLGEYYYSSDNFKTALEYQKKALLLFENLNNTTYKAKVNYSLGLTYHYLNNYDESLDAYQKSLSLFESLGNKEMVAINYHDIGTLYNDLEKYKLAYEYYNKALQVYIETDNKERQAAIYQNIGVLYNNWGNFDQALDYYQKSLAIYEELKDKLNIAISFSNIGLIYENQKEYYQALEYYQRSLVMFEEVDYKPALVYIFYNLGSIYDNLKESIKAEEYFQRGLKLSKELGMKDFISYNYEGLSDVLEKRGDFKNALYYYKDFVDVRDSILNESKIQQINELEAKFQNTQKQKEIEFLKLDQRLQESELQKKEAQNLILIFSSFLAFIIAVILFLFNRYQKRASTRLEKEVQEHLKTEEKLNNLTKDLENRVQERTSELENINIKLLKEAKEHEKTLQNLEIAKNRAEEADNVKSKFLANISHEVRTPLNAISGFSEMLGKDNLPKNKKFNYINIIKESCSNLTNLIDDIVDYASIESGEIIIEKSDFNPHPILEFLYDHFTNELIRQKKDVILAYDNENTDPDLIINADPSRFKQILSIIINNAIKFTDEGKIEFGFIYPDNEHIEFFVKDTGIGISKDYSDLIFERFRQVDESSTKEYGGAGIGLSVAKNLVDMHDGEIWFESTVGKGTTFYIKFPHKQEKQDQLETIEFDNYNWHDKIILVAEDKKINFEIIKETLLVTDVELLWAKNGLEAIEIIQSRNDIDLVLMDIQMPLLDGYETTRRIKEYNPAIKIIAQTAYALPKDNVKCFEAGCDDYIAKPISLNNFIKKLNNYLS